MRTDRSVKGAMASDHCGGPMLSVNQMKGRQSTKIKEMRHALASAGLLSLDRQADALGLPRSTTWTIVKGQHKSSGLSTKIINRMLAAPRLPTRVRETILEYVAEKTAGRYGDGKVRLRGFKTRLGLDGP
jgi:hypothetical protein